MAAITSVVFYNPPVIAGFKEDMMSFVEKLTQLYQEEGQKTVEQFLKVWKEMKLSLIFTGRLLFRELCEFTEYALKLTKDVILFEKEYPRRCALIFLLFGLYLKQPPRPKIKIRLTLSDLKGIISLMEESSSLGDFNVTYIFYKLLEQQAFVYVVCDDPVGLEISSKQIKEEIVIKNSHFAPDLDRLSSKIMSVKDLNNRYAALKKSLITIEMDDEDKASLKVVSKKYPDRMMKMLQPELKISTEEPKELLKVEKDVGERRKALKERSCWGVEPEIISMKTEEVEQQQCASFEASSYTSINLETKTLGSQEINSSPQSKKIRREYPYEESGQAESESIYDEFYGRLGLKQDPVLQDHE